MARIQCNYGRTDGLSRLCIKLPRFGADFADVGCRGLYNISKQLSTPLHIQSGLEANNE